MKKFVKGLFSTKKKAIITIICLVLIVALVFTLTSKNKKKKETGPAISFIRTTVLKKQTLADTISANGLIATEKSSTVSGSGEVAEILVAVGDYVEKDQVVAILDSEDKLDRVQEAYDDAAKAYKDYIYVLKEVGVVYNNYATTTSPTNKYSCFDSPAAYLDTLESIYNRSTGASRVQAYNQYNTAKSQYEKVIDAKADALENLEDAMDEFSLKAKTSGYIATVPAKVGDTLSQSGNTTVCTIQDTDNLVVNISIYEYDIDKVYEGMPAKITSDSFEGEIDGIVTEVSPVATGGRTASATFAVKVRVLNGNNGLHVGVNAKVKLIVSQKDDCWNVPLDAVETKENGDTIVYLKTGGEGLNMTFKEVKVTTGEQNDYYIEIDSPELKDGDEIRASADLTAATYQGTKTEDSALPTFNMGMGGGMSGNSRGGYGGGPRGGF